MSIATRPQSAAALSMRATDAERAERRFNLLVAISAVLVLAATVFAITASISADSRAQERYRTTVLTSNATTPFVVRVTRHGDDASLSIEDFNQAIAKGHLIVVTPATELAERSGKFTTTAHLVTVRRP
jgi:predicted membrane-bound spermidine synthase